MPPLIAQIKVFGGSFAIRRIIDVPGDIFGHVHLSILGNFGPQPANNTTTDLLLCSGWHLKTIFTVNLAFLHYQRSKSLDVFRACNCSRPL